jgi:hypothetical protein
MARREDTMNWNKKPEVMLSKNALAGKRGASNALTPHVCPVCNERVPENQLIIAMQIGGGKRGSSQGYHRDCFSRAS